MLRCSDCGSERGFNALKTYVFQVELNEEALVEETHGIKHDLDHEPYIPSYEETKEEAVSQVDCLRKQGLPAFYAAKPCYEEIACQQKAF